MTYPFHIDMSAATKTLVLALDLLGTFVFALSGALAGARHRLDFFGIMVLSFAAGNFGGITRDLLIGAVPPAAISNWYYVAVSLAAGVVTFFWHPTIARKQELLKAQDPRVLATLECILSTPDDRWNNWTLSSAKEEIQVRVTGKVTTNQYTLVRRYALDGLGIARLPYYMVSDDLHQGKLVQLFPSYEIATHPLYLVYRKGSYTPKRIKIARDAIIAWFSNRPGIFLKHN